MPTGTLSLRDVSGETVKLDRGSVAGGGDAIERRGANLGYLVAVGPQIVEVLVGFKGIIGGQLGEVDALRLVDGVQIELDPSLTVRDFAAGILM